MIDVTPSRECPAGLGRAIAVAFGQQGARVGLIARDLRHLEDACVEMREAGGRAFPVVAEVADADAVERAASLIEAQLGQIDVWVNNAMVSLFARTTQITPDATPVKQTMPAGAARRIASNRSDGAPVHSRTTSIGLGTSLTSPL